MMEAHAQMRAGLEVGHHAVERTTGSGRSEKLCPAMPRHIALLRGINLGSRNRVSMPDLRELLAAHGHKDVATLVQSGNIVLTSRLSPRRLERDLQKQIADGLGVDTPVIVRTRDELADVIARDPMGDVVDNPKLYQVTFLAEEPAADLVAEIDGMDVAPERVHLSGRELYTWHPNGIQRAKVDRLRTMKRLPTGTARNWNTVTKLLELADGGA
jgi:uncharacterized protein (DUF1697 family)